MTRRWVTAAILSSAVAPLVAACGGSDGATTPASAAPSVTAAADNGPGAGFSLTECGSVTDPEVVTATGRSNLARVSKNLLGCRWETGLTFGTSSEMTFFWYRGSSMAKEANLASTFGHTVTSITVGGHPGYSARSSNELCEVSAGSGPDFIHWSIDYGDRQPHPDPCAVVLSLAQMTVDRST